jgi:hypothetical protein
MFVASPREVVVSCPRRSKTVLLALAGLITASGCRVTRDGLLTPTASGATRGDDAAAPVPPPPEEPGPIGGMPQVPDAMPISADAAPDAGLAADAAIAVSMPAAPPDAAPDVPRLAPKPGPGPDCPDTPSLALCLRFEGAIADEAPAHADIGPAAVAYVMGPSGLAVDLSPTGQITLADSPLFYSPTVTLEAWVQPHSLARATPIIEHQGQYGLTVLPDGTAVCAAGLASALRATAVNVDGWTSLACTIDTRSVALWIDGVKVAESAATTLAVPPASRLTVGWGGPPETTFDGLLDNVRLWRTVRTPEQLCAGALICRGPS